MNRRIYLDWNATAPLLPEVREAMVRVMDRAPGNASSVHREGQVARSVIERARRAVASAVGAHSQAVVLTGGATESNNQVLSTHARYTPNAFVACSCVEHPSVLEVVEHLAQEGTRTQQVPVQGDGTLDLEAVDRLLSEGLTLLSVMWANNEVGNIYPIAELAQRVHREGALLHVDATQAFGRIPMDFERCGADFMSLSFHKMGGPKGIGAVVAREGLAVNALLFGGHQERGRRPGTENVVAAAGLEAAAKAVQASLHEWGIALKRKRELFLGSLGQQIQELELRGDSEVQLPQTLNMALDGLDGEDLLLALDLEGVSASSGSACTAGSLEPSHVLLAMGYPAPVARQSVRFSFGPLTDDDDLVEAAARVSAVCTRLRGLR